MPNALRSKYPFSGVSPADAQAPPVESGVGIVLSGERLLVVVRGEMGGDAVLVLSAVFDAVTTVGEPVVVDLSDLDSADSAGLMVIATAGRRLATRGGQLTVRSSLRVAGCISAIVGPSPWLRFEPPATDRPRPDARSRTRDQWPYPRHGSGRKLSSDIDRGGQP